MALAMGLDVCPCDHDPKCKRSGKCEECIANHKVHPTKPLPWCMRAENAEKVEVQKKAQNK